MYDAWTLVGVGGGSAALTWLAAGRMAGADGTGPHTFRLSLDSGNSLVGDVRFLGGALAWVASMYTEGKTKSAMQTVAAASLFSLVQTELIRMRLVKMSGGSGSCNVSTDTKYFPAYGGLPGAQPQYQSAPAQNAGAWAHR